MIQKFELSGVTITIYHGREEDESIEIDLRGQEGLNAERFGDQFVIGLGAVEIKIDAATGESLGGSLLAQSYKEPTDAKEP